jgi:hypothetical protein
VILQDLASQHVRDMQTSATAARRARRRTTFGAAGQADELSK